MPPNKSKLNRQGIRPAYFLAVLFLSFWGTSPAALAACEAPSLAVSMPDGKTASVEDMSRAKSAVNAYVAAGEAYIECVDSEQGRMQAEKVRNEMLDEMEKVAGAFNRQLRVFKKAQS